jgi:hypothetical protein
MPTKVQGRANKKAHESRANKKAHESSVTSAGEYRRRARNLLEMANTCQDTQIAARLRVIAADYFDCAAQDGGQVSGEGARSSRTRRKAA